LKLIYNGRMLSLELNHSELGIIKIQGGAEETAAFLKILFGSEFQTDTINQPASPAHQTSNSIHHKRSSKRQCVLDSLQGLHNEGLSEPSIDQITHYFKTHFPEQDASHLDQVLRDLVNKTDLVRRPKWGCFQLVQ